MWKVKKKEEMLISKKEAEEILLLNTYAAQRPINGRHLEQIKGAVKDETFRTGHIAIATLKDEKSKKMKYLMNGQHQLTAVSQLDAVIIAFYEEIECENWNDIAQLFGTFDQGGRGLGDLIKPYADAFGIDWPISMTRIILSGGLLKDGRLGWDRQKKAAALNDYIKPGNFVISCFQENGKISWKDFEHMRRRSIIGAMMITYEKSEKQAMQFWTDVKDGVNLQKKSPALALRDFLKGNAVDHERDDKEVYKKCIVAWNAFRKNESTQLKIFNGTMPKVL